MRKAHLLAALALPLGLAVACKQDQKSIFPEEETDVFNGGVRQVVQPFEDKWVLYYFPDETPDSIKRKLQASEFYQSNGWRELKANAPYAYAFGRKATRQGELVSITIQEGKLNSDLINVTPTGGCSLLLVPAPR